MFGHPALRALFWMKLRGGLRRQVRRLRRPSSWIFLLAGLVLVGLWIVSYVASSTMRSRGAVDPELQIAFASSGIFVLVALTVVGAFSYRGLYLPKEEIELVFSAPLSREQLIRYRLGTNVARGLGTGLFFGVGAALRAPNPAFGFLGMLVTMLTVPILGQATAILLGDAENRLGKLAQRLPLRSASRLLLVVLLAGLAWLFVSAESLLEGSGAHSGGPLLERVFAHPAVAALLAPFRPWARTIVASSAADFWPWFLFCAGFALVAYELAARIRVDFRELSLATSADVAKRIQKMRRGGFGAASDAPASLGALRRVPWVLGTSPFGAVAWLKLAAIARRSRTALLVSAFFLSVLVIAASRMNRVPNEGSVLFVAAFGTIYLCLGLRLDFRADLELMDRIKAWPLAPWKVFLATILPEASIVVVLVTAAALVTAALIGAWSPPIFAALASIPAFVLVWSTLDNAVFLFMPVRFTPGQEGALQHMGRSVVLMLARFALFGIVGAAAVVPGLAAGWAVGAWTDSRNAALAAGTCVALAGVGGVVAALVWAGGRMLARFDVARDKPI